jgi:DNA repair exonuclease SbcCD ATPase subunit
MNQSLHDDSFKDNTPLGPSGMWTGDALHEHFTTRHHDIEKGVGSRIGDLQAQIDRRIDTQARERTDTEKHLSAQVEGLRREMQTISQESHRAITEAGNEREKAAQALSTNMRQSIKEGDDRLREHIENQVNQIEAALEAARRETHFANDSAKTAIEKGETATDKRFDAVNEFRKELGDRWARTMPREVAESMMAEFEKRLDKTERDMDKRGGAEAAVDRRKQAVQPWAIWVAGAILAIFIVVVNILVSMGGTP